MRNWRPYNPLTILIFTLCLVPALDKGLICNRPKQVVRSCSTQIEGESLPLLGWVSAGLTLFYKARIDEIAGGCQKFWENWLWLEHCKKLICQQQFNVWREGNQVNAVVQCLWSPVKSLPMYSCPGQTWIHSRLFCCQLRNMVTTRTPACSSLKHKKKFQVI